MCDQSTTVGTDVRDQGIPCSPLVQSSADLEESDEFHVAAPAAGLRLLGKGGVGGSPPVAHTISQASLRTRILPDCLLSCFLPPLKVPVAPFLPHLKPCSIDHLKLS